MAIGGSTDRKSRILVGVYGSSMGISMTALTIVAVLEVFMLGYSVVNAPMYGEYLWRYRLFYIALLTFALVYIAIFVFVNKDMDHRFTVLNVANPLYAGFFYAWSLGITFHDAIIWGTIDSMVFMTFSLMVPLSFFLFPSVYAVIVVIADAFMLYLTVSITGSVASIINLSIFCVFQIVLGISFLRLRLTLAERIVEERDNADIDALTGFANRRVYDQDIRKLTEEPVQPDLVYVSIDLNGLKEVNDLQGHEAGDKLIIGATMCISQCFGEKGKLYRIGGDEFVVLLSADRDQLERLFREYDACVESWSKRNDMNLSTAYGYACYAEFPDEGVPALARVADERMYAAKARYYQASGKDRRRYVLEKRALEEDAAEVSC